MLAIGISKHALTTQCGRDFFATVRPLVVLCRGKPRLLGAVEKLNLRGGIAFVDERGVLDLPKTFAAAARHFLERYHSNPCRTYDCYAFACDACGIERHASKYMLRHWRVQPLRRPRVGQVIFLCKWHDKHFFAHAALNIGRGLYLSVYGAGGYLFVSTLEDMKRDFKAKRVYRATPRKL